MARIDSLAGLAVATVQAQALNELSLSFVRRNIDAQTQVALLAGAGGSGGFVTESRGQALNQVV